jgi:hypothetical protein
MGFPRGHEGRKSNLRQSSSFIFPAVVCRGWIRTPLPPNAGDWRAHEIWHVPRRLAWRPNQARRCEFGSEFDQTRPVLREAQFFCPPQAIIQQSLTCSRNDHGRGQAGFTPHLLSLGHPSTPLNDRGQLFERLGPRLPRPACMTGVERRPPPPGASEAAKATQTRESLTFLRPAGRAAGGSWVWTCARASSSGQFRRYWPFQALNTQHATTSGPI